MDEKCKSKIEEKYPTELLKITPDYEIYYRKKFFRKDKELALMLLDVGNALIRDKDNM